MSTIGKHCVLELYGCDAGRLNDRDFILATMRNAAETAGATWLNQCAHKFEPQGVTALGLLSESHISMHTWPELGYAACDVFTCGEHCDPEVASKQLAHAFRATSYNLKTLPRAARLTPDRNGNLAVLGMPEPGSVFLDQRP